MKRSPENRSERLAAVARLYDDVSTPDGAGPRDGPADTGPADTGPEDRALAEAKFVLDHDMPRRPQSKVVDLITAEAARAHRAALESNANPSGLGLLSASAAAEAAGRTNGRGTSAGKMRLMRLPRTPVFRFAAAACVVLLVGLVGVLALQEGDLVPALESTGDASSPTAAAERRAEQAFDDAAESVRSEANAPQGQASAAMQQRLAAEGSAEQSNAVRSNTNDGFAVTGAGAPVAAKSVAVGRNGAQGFVLAGSLDADVFVPSAATVWDDTPGVWRVRRRIEQLEANTIDLNWDNAVVPLEMPPGAREGAPGRTLIRDNRRDNN